ncbi:SWIM zinc finger family protein [Micromonospora echinofusca]|uniref:SWIM zinc finger family protein n=1 Tax=Micromonospora echinofusca TaxID=47858 RepID=UPI000C7055CA
MTETAHAVSYVRSSEVYSADGSKIVGLETSGGRTSKGAEANPGFFSGFLTDPRIAASGLLAVADVAATRYYQPTLKSSLDPVVTGNGDRLRFESFSGCCGVYARLDILTDGLDGGEVGQGTTNVDVNPPLRIALSRIHANDPLYLRVGPDELAVTTLDGPLVEKKVPLPQRWLRGFAETQVIASGFDLCAEVPAADAARFLRSLPTRGRVPDLWVLPVGRTLRTTGAPAPGAVCLPGPSRLATLERVLRHARTLRLYGPSVTAGSPPLASAWEVTLPGMRLTLMLSPQVSRGFSGEGAVLEALAADEVRADADLISVLLAWEPRIDVADLAARAGLTTHRVRSALTRLGTAGRVGYDAAEAAYFHRELPYRVGQAELHNPRLRDARALARAGAVTVDGETASVRSGDKVYLVDHRSAVMGCTCPWWAGHRGGRGPCKHALAVRMTTRGDD